MLIFVGDFCPVSSTELCREWWPEEDEGGMGGFPTIITDWGLLSVESFFGEDELGVGAGDIEERALPGDVSDGLRSFLGEVTPSLL